MVTVTFAKSNQCTVDPEQHPDEGAASCGVFCVKLIGDVLPHSDPLNLLNLDALEERLLESSRQWRRHGHGGGGNLPLLLLEETGTLAVGLGSGAKSLQSLQNEYPDMESRSKKMEFLREFVDDEQRLVDILTKSTVPSALLATGIPKSARSYREISGDTCVIFKLEFVFWENIVSFWEGSRTPPSRTFPPTGNQPVSVGKQKPYTSQTTQ